MNRLLFFTVAYEESPVCQVSKVKAVLPETLYSKVKLVKEETMEKKVKRIFDLRSTNSLNKMRLI